MHELPEEIVQILMYSWNMLSTPIAHGCIGGGDDLSLSRTTK
jgi:hypothetical protein